MTPSYKLKNYNTAVRTVYTETNDLFPRDQHPDNRTGAEFIADLVKRVHRQEIKPQMWYPMKKSISRVGKPIMCVNTGTHYSSILQACKDLKLDNTRMVKHLRGDLRYKYVNGYRFKLA